MFKKFKIALIILGLTFLPCAKAFASGQVWVNDLRKLFLSNGASIYELNIRTFNANDTDGDGIIEFSEGEESGTFINVLQKCVLSINSMFFDLSSGSSSKYIVSLTLLNEFKNFSVTSR